MNVERHLRIDERCHARVLPNLPHQLRKLRAGQPPERNAVRVRKCPMALGKLLIVQRRSPRVLECQKTRPRKRQPPRRLRPRNLLLERSLRPCPAGHEHKLGRFLDIIISNYYNE